MQSPHPGLSSPCAHTTAIPFAARIAAAAASATLDEPPLGPLESLGVGPGATLVHPIEANGLGVGLLPDVGAKRLVVLLTGE